MKLEIFAIFLILSATYSQGALKCPTRIKVAIVDTGLNLEDPRFKDHLCSGGHIDFTGEGIVDTDSHGTHIAGLIKKYAKNANYCLLIYKYYSIAATGSQNMEREVAAMQAAVDNGADIVNLSDGGLYFSEDEYLIIKNHPNVSFVTAAGNEGMDLDLPNNNYYPGSYFLPNEFVIENIGFDGKKIASSNWSKRTKGKEVGYNVLSTLPNGKIGYMTGTSQAAAIFSGKLVDKYSKKCNYR